MTNEKEKRKREEKDERNVVLNVRVPTRLWARPGAGQRPTNMSSIWNATLNTACNSVYSVYRFVLNVRVTLWVGACLQAAQTPFNMSSLRNATLSNACNSLYSLSSVVLSVRVPTRVWVRLRAARTPSNIRNAILNTAFILYRLVQN